MAFSYEEWKKRDNQRIKATSTMPSFEQWDGTRSKAQLLSKGLGDATYENHAARQLAKAIERTPGERGRAANTRALLEDSKSHSTEQSKSKADKKEKSKKDFDFGDIFTIAKNAALEALPSKWGMADVARGALNSDNKNETLSEKIGTNLRAGTGDFIKQIGDALDYVGIDKIGKNISDFGENISEGYGEAYKNGKEFTWSNLLDPEYYATNVSRQLPQLGTMFIGGGVGLGIKGATALTKLPTLARTIAGVAGGTTAMTALESAMEAGSVYEEAKNRGMSEKAAKEAADETFKKNLALTGSTSALELALAMTPLTKGLSKVGVGRVGQLGAATAGGAITEGVQEGFQNKISTEALGDEFKWTDPNTVESMVIGGLLGGAGTGSMSLLQSDGSHGTGDTTGTQNNATSRSTLDDITQRTINSLPDERRTEFDELVDSARQSGKSFYEAQLEALEEMASKYEDVQESTGQSARDYMIDKELERQSGTLNNVSPMERNLKEQEKRNTLEYTFADESPNYQFNPFAIAEKGQAIEIPGARQAALQQPNVTNQQSTSPLQVLQQALRQAPNNNQTVPSQDVAATIASPLQIEQQMPQQETGNVNVPAITNPANALLQEQDNSQLKENATKQPRGLIESLEAGDEVKLKGTRADTTYTVLEDDGGKHVQVETPSGRAIKVARNAIEQINMRRSEANVLADPIADVEIDTINSIVEDVQQPSKVNEVNSPGIKEDEIVVEEKNVTKGDIPTDTMKRIGWMRKKMNDLDYTAQEIKDQFIWLRDNAETIKEDIYQQVKENPKHKRKQEKTKRALVEDIYNASLERLAYADSDVLTYTGGNIFDLKEKRPSKAQQLEEKINSLDDEKIGKHIASKNKARESIKSPQSLEDFQRASSQRKLTETEQAKYDELQALRERERQKEKPNKNNNEIVKKGNFKIIKDTDTRDGSDIWVVSLNERVSKEEFSEIRKDIKGLGGYWSGFKKGFVFKSDPSSKLEGSVQEDTGEEVASNDSVSQAQLIADKLRATAEGMQKAIDQKRNDNRLTNTARRAAIDSSMREEADMLERQQQIMFRIAEAIANGEAVFLDNVTARTHIETLLRIKNKMIRDRIDSRENELKAKNPNSYLKPHEREKIASEQITESEINALQLPKPEISLYQLNKVIQANTGTKGLGKIAIRLNKFLKENKFNSDFSNQYANATNVREEVLKLADFAIKNDNERYYAEMLKAAFDTTKRLEAMKLNTTPSLRSGMREFLRYVDDVGENVEQKKKDAQRKLEAELTQSKIEGFFPTPQPIVDQMLIEASIEPGMKVLEPSAGKGNIAARIQEELTEGQLDVVEWNSKLRNYLEESNYNVVGEDFLAYETGGYDRIIMNPPFENGQDIDHVRHAYELLEPGGRIVAIMSEGPFFRGDKKASSFREWLEDLDGVSEQLPPNSFKDSERSTGVATRIVTIDKPLENNRDTFIIERVDQKPFVVKRGDKILRYISKDNFVEEEVNSISQSKQEINGVPFGYIYPLDYKEQQVKNDSRKPSISNVVGNAGKAYTEAGTEIQFNYEVVDAQHLIASHDTALRTNPDYPPELQPRDRSRQASKQQVTTMAQKLNPELVVESAKASDGAPIVSKDYTVESGNGRTIAIQKMYQESYDTANDYKSYLVEHAEKYGLDKNAIEQMEKPVLVRVRTNDVNRQSFVEEANVSNVASMSATEQAVADAKKLTNKVMYLFSPSENGDLNVASNRAFISQFIQSVVPQNERGSLMTADGNLSQDGLRRVQNAILAKAYGNNDALLLMIESNDNNVKTLTNAMLQAAPTIANMKESIEAGAYFAEDISPDFVAAVEKFSELRKEGVTVETFLNQASLFDDGLSNVSRQLLQLFDKGVVIEGKARKSTKAYKSLLEAYADVLQNAGNPNQISFFEENAPIKDDLFEAAIKKVSAETDEVQTDLFSDESSSSEPSRRSGQSSNTETFVSARQGKRKEDKIKPGETTRAEIIQYIKDNFQVRLDVGKFRQKAKGIYKNKFSIIRTKDYGDFEVIAHELGHRFDIRHGWSSDPELKQEWIRFAEANLELPESMTPLQRAKEGVAEYFRQYLYAETEATVDYQELSDRLHQKVEEGLKKSKWSKPLESLQGKMMDWMNRDAEQELRGVVTSIGQGKKQRVTAKQFITKWYARVFEKEHPIYSALKQIEKETGLKFEGRHNAYEMAVLTRGTVARAATFIKRETFNSVTGERTGESLESILKDVDDVEAFGRYLVAKHGLYLIEKKGKSKTPLSPDLMKQYLESGGRYEAHAERIYQYQQDLLQVLVDGNLIPEELPGKLKEAYPYYVPFYRVMTETGEKGKGGSGGGSSQQFSNQQQGIKRMSEAGSARNIINPIESIIRNTHLYFGLADRNAVGYAMGELANPDSEFAAEVTRDIIEEIPSKMKLYEGQIKQIQKSLLDAGLEADMLEDMDMEQTFKVFEPMFKPSAANNEILVWKEGKPKLYKVHDDLLYNALIAYDNRAVTEAFGIFFKPFEKSNNLIRSGITASPYFTVRTFWRSLAQIFVKTEATGINYITHPARVAKAWGSVLKSVFSDVNSKIPESKAVSEWWKSGGAQSTFISVENQYLNRELDKIALNKKAKHYIRSMRQGTWKERKVLNWYLAKSTASFPFKVLQTFNDTLDQALKLAEYQVVKKQTGSRQKAALASREADVDYKRFGSATREFNKITLFFNVSLQGPDNIARTFAKHKLRTSVRALTLLTLPTLLLYAMNRDDEEYQELDSWEKDMNWLIPMGGGEFVKIPIPFEIGVLFKTIPEKLFGEYLDAQKGEDKQSWDKIYGNALSTMTPTMMPTLANVWYSYVTEENLNFKREFVPMSLQKLQKPDQYTENTSEIMKFLGKKLNKSPMTLEETFKAQFGQMGQGYLYGLDQLLITTGVVEKPDTKGLKRSYTERYFTSSINDGGTNSITQFYEELDKKERDYASNGVRYSPPEDLKLYRKVQDDMKTLRKLRDAMMYDRIKDADGQSFSKEIKKDHVDTINMALRDMARIARAQGDKPNKSEEAIMKDLDKAVLNKDNLDKAIIMLEDYEKYLKAVEKEQRQEAKKLQQ